MYPCTDRYGCAMYGSSSVLGNIDSNKRASYFLNGKKYVLFL